MRNSALCNVDLFLFAGDCFATSASTLLLSYCTATLVSLFHQLLESNDYVIELHFTKAGPISNSLKLVNVKKTKEFTAPTLVSLYEIPYPI